MRVLQYTSPEFAADCVKMYAKKARIANHAVIWCKREGRNQTAAMYRGHAIMAITCARFWSLYVKGVLK
jgi:hypothetical protein